MLSFTVVRNRLRFVLWKDYVEVFLGIQHLTEFLWIVLWQTFSRVSFGHICIHPAGNVSMGGTAGSWDIFIFNLVDTANQFSKTAAISLFDLWMYHLLKKINKNARKEDIKNKVNIAKICNYLAINKEKKTYFMDKNILVFGKIYAMMKQIWFFKVYCL